MDSINKLDNIKLASALLLVVVAIIGFYTFDQALLYRVLGLLMAVGLAVAITLTTQTGHTALSFLKNVQTEVQKVVWPTRVETLQTTLLVVIMVLIVAIFLWLLDILFAWLIGGLIG